VEKNYVELWTDRQLEWEPRYALRIANKSVSAYRHLEAITCEFNVWRSTRFSGLTEFLRIQRKFRIITNPNKFLRILNFESFGSP